MVVYEKQKILTESYSMHTIIKLLQTSQMCNEAGCILRKLKITTNIGLHIQLNSQWKLFTVSKM